MTASPNTLAAARASDPSTVPAGVRRRQIWVRVVLVALGLLAWFGTQALIGRRELHGAGLRDRIHEATAPTHAYLLAHPAAADALLTVSSLAIDALGIFLIARSILGPTLRPLLALFMLFAMRQACQGLCSLPTPEGMIWHSPGVPALFVTYGVSNDLFFSGHTGLAVLGALELGRLRRPRLTALGIVLAAFEAMTVLVLRAHYTIDVVAGAAVAVVAANIADRLAPDGELIQSRVFR